MNYQQLPTPELIKWIKFWKNEKNKFAVLALSYTADPEKDPDRLWKEWYEKEKNGTPKAVWDKEYEIDFSTKSGKLIYWPDFCDFNPWHHFIDSFKVKWELILALDFGQQNPTHALVWVYTDEWRVYIIDEYSKPAIPSVSSREMFQKFAYIMWKTEDEINKMSFDEKRNLASDTFQIMVIDPTTRAKNRTKKEFWEEIEYSIIEDFYDNWWDFIPWTNDVDSGITRMREYFQIWEDWKSHLYIFKDKCPNLCWEIQKYKYRELGEAQWRMLNQPEKPVKKDDHGPDACRYLIMTRPVHPTRAPRKLTVIEKDIQKILRPKVIANDWDID